jgi:hypothetical protein
VKIGDVVSFSSCNDKMYLGMIVDIRDIDENGSGVSPPQVDILWENGDIETTWQDEINLMEENIKVLI